jgi:hypothetical protein
MTASAQEAEKRYGRTTGNSDGGSPRQGRKVGEDGDDGGAKRRSSACTAAHQVRLGGGGVLEQLRLRFSEEEEGTTAAPSPRSAQRAAANNDGKDGDLRQDFLAVLSDETEDFLSMSLSDFCGAAERSRGAAQRKRSRVCGLIWRKGRRIEELGR